MCRSDNTSTRDMQSRTWRPPNPRCFANLKMNNIRCVQIENINETRRPPQSTTLISGYVSDREGKNEPADRPSRPSPTRRESSTSGRRKNLSIAELSGEQPPRHRARDPVTLTPLDLAGPAVTASPIAVADGTLAFVRLGCRDAQHRARELGIG